MPVTPRTKRCVIGLLVAVACCLVIAWFPDREPAYKGRTIHQWLRQPSGPEQHDALMILGTNNLPLLIERIAYDQGKDRTIGLFHRLPPRLQRSRAFAFLSRKSFLADDAMDTIGILGGKAGSAVPLLTEMAATATADPATRARVALDRMGPQGWSGLISLTMHSNQALADQALLTLANHTNSLAVREAVTNALTHTSPAVRAQVEEIIAGRAFE